MTAHSVTYTNTKELVEFLEIAKTAKGRAHSGLCNPNLTRRCREVRRADGGNVFSNMLQGKIQEQFKNAVPAVPFHTAVISGYDLFHSLQAEAVICLVFLGGGGKAGGLQRREPVLPLGIRQSIRCSGNAGSAGNIRNICALWHYGVIGNRIADLQAEKSFPRPALYGDHPPGLLKFYACLYGVVQCVRIQCTDIDPVKRELCGNIRGYLRTDTASVHCGLFHGQHGVDGGIAAVGQRLHGGRKAGQISDIGVPLCSRQGGQDL